MPFQLDFCTTFHHISNTMQRQLNAKHPCTIHHYVGDSKLTVMMITAAQPQYQFYCCIPTRDKYQDGKPHALEHLIFNGSNLYPCNDYLNQTIQHFINNGTNAWTATDHTCYTAETAELAGLHAILPVYLNHIFYPTLTADHFITEVYDGNDGGVVFNEMKAKESGPMYLGYNAMAKKLYPHTCLGNETGGLTDCIRSLTIDDLLQYHKNTYLPNRSAIIIVGNFNEQSIQATLDILNEIDVSLVPLNDNIPSNSMYQQCIDKETAFVKSYRDDLRICINNNNTRYDSITENTIKILTYPESNTTHGSLMLGFTGPLIHHHYSNALMTVLLDSLMVGDASPLELLIAKNTMATSIDYFSMDYCVKSYLVHLHNVPVDIIMSKDIIINHTTIIMKTINKFMIDLQSGATEIIKRILDILDGEIIHYQHKLETSPGELAFGAALLNHLYCSKIPKSFDKIIRYLDILKDIRTNIAMCPMSNTFLKHLQICAIHLNQPTHVLAMIPVRKQSLQKTSPPNQRLANQLSESIQRNKDNKCTPAHLANVNAIQHDIAAIIDPTYYVVNTTLTNMSDQSNLSILRPIRALAINTTFVLVVVNINTESFTFDDRCCLAFLSYCWFKSNIHYNDKKIPYELIEQYLIKNCVQDDLYIHPYCPNVVKIVMKFIKQSQISHYIHFVLENIKAIILDKRTKQLHKKRLVQFNDVWTRDMASLRDIHEATINSVNNNKVAYSPLIQRYFLNKYTFCQLEEKLTTLREKLTDDVFEIEIACNNNVDANMDSNIDAESIAPLNGCEEDGQSKCRTNAIPQNHGYVINEYDSAYLISSIRGVGVRHNLYAATMVFAEYLSLHEGPLWDTVRGKGLAYTVRVLVDKKGWIHAYLARSTAINDAYMTLITTIQTCIEDFDFDNADTLLRPAKYALINDIVSHHESKWDVIHGALSMPPWENSYSTFIQSRVDQIKSVNSTAIKSAMEYFKQYTDHMKPIVSVLGNQHHCESLKQTFPVEGKEFVLMNRDTK